MPIYVYRCDNAHTFEVLQSMSEDSLDTCEVCGAPAQRVLFAPALHFKGSGFYTTDYARKGAGNASNGSSEESSKESKSESKSDSSKSSDSESSDSASSSKAESKATSSKGPED